MAAFQVGWTKFVLNRLSLNVGAVTQGPRDLADDEKDYRGYIDAYITQQHQAGEKSPQPPRTRRPLPQYRLWRTYQMSGHLPLWAELRIDFADDYLRELSKQQMP